MRPRDRWPAVKIAAGIVPQPELTPSRIRDLRDQLAAMEYRRMKIERENAARWEMLWRTPPPPIPPSDVEETGNLATDLFNYEKQALLRALDYTGGNKGMAADMIGYTRRIFAYKIKTMGLEGECQRILSEKTKVIRWHKRQTKRMTPEKFQELPPPHQPEPESQYHRARAVCRALRRTGTDDGPGD